MTGAPTAVTLEYTHDADAATGKLTVSATVLLCFILLQLYAKGVSRNAICA